MNLINTREAIADALAWGHRQRGDSGIVEYTTYMARIEKSMSQGDSCVDMLEAAYICAAINLLPHHLGGWLKYAYGPVENDMIHQALACHLKNLFRIRTPKQNSRYLILSWCSLDDFRLNMAGKRLPIVLICERLESNPDHFSRDFGKAFKTLHEEIKRWDAESVGRVSSVVASLGGRSDSSASEILACTRREFSI